MTTPASVGDNLAKSARHPPYVLGVDGGGTKTLAWLAEINERGESEVIGHGTAGSSNRVAVGLDAALNSLEQSIRQAFAEAELAPAPIASTVFALAGSAAEHVRREILDFARQRCQIESPQVVHDGLAVLQTAAPDGWGIALIVGTGAVAYGVNRACETAVVGGWGYWFGDEGSAFWLGQTALRAISHADDGRGAATELTSAVLKRLQIEQPREIIAALSGGGNARQDVRPDVRLAIADLADLVCAAAEQQDAAATQIVGTAAQHWSQHIKSLARKLELGKQFPLALAGGVLGGSAFARDRLSQQLVADQLDPSPVEFVAKPVAGCLQLAASNLKSTQGPDFVRSPAPDL